MPHWSSAAEGACMLAQKATRCRPRGEGWDAHCPAHPDKTHSLTLMPRDERIVLACTHGCSPAAIVAALGYTLADLFYGPPPPAGAPRPLLPAHAAMLHASAIADDLIAHRGYVTLTEGSQLRERGFSPGQALGVPCLGIPLWTVHGEPHGWQIRPDTPRLDLHGTPRKYETPRGNRLILDVHPSVQPHLGDPTVDLWITEGVKKGDALASQGVCALALMGGVWGWRGSNRQGGKTVLPDWGSVALNGRDVYIVYDNDVMRNLKVRGALAGLYQFLVSKDARPHLLLLPDSADKIGVDDYLAAGHTLAEVRAGETTRLPQPEHAPDLADGRPRIQQAAHAIPAVVTQALAALAALPDGPRVLQRAGQLCVVAPAPPQAAGLQRPPGAPRIQALDPPRLRYLLAHAAHWFTPTKSGSHATPDKPAAWLLETLLTLGTWEGIPPLTGLLSAPALRPDGTLLTTPGYDPPTGLYLVWPHDPPALPEPPTHAEAVTAAALLAEPFRDFPFEAAHHRSAVLAALLSLLARYAVGHVPLFAIRATTRGSGKTLLADAISVIATGRPAAKMPPARDEDEERKRLLAIALAGDPLVVIDNVTGALGTPALDVALTSLTFKDRLLGTNETTEAPLDAVFLATGNQMTFRGDTARRVVPIDLLPDVERPEERTDFAHPKLLAYLSAQRPTLVAAALTLLRAYVVAGRPPQGLTPYGSFEAWSDLIRAALVWAGQPDPCLGRVGLEASSDEAYDSLAALLEAWHACYGDKPQTLKTVFRHLTMYAEESDYQRLQEALDGFGDNGTHEKKVSLRHVGHALKKVEKRIINHTRFENQGDSGRDGRKWAVKIV